VDINHSLSRLKLDVNKDYLTQANLTSKNFKRSDKGATLNLKMDNDLNN